MPRETLVLAVGIDELTLSRLRSAMHGTEFQMEAVSPDVAVSRAKFAQSSIIVLLEWTALAIEKGRLCAALREAAGRHDCYVIAIGGLADPTLAAAVAGPVDDVICRPFGSDPLLLHRLRVASASMRAGRMVITAKSALDEAVTGARTGEVVVRSGDVVGHVHVQDGEIVWAHVSSLPPTIAEILEYAGVTLDAETLEATRDECEATRAHFMDVLVARQLISPAAAEQALRGFIAARTDLVLALPDAAALFLPKSTTGSGRVRLSVQDIPSLRTPPPPPPVVALYRASLPPPSITISTADVETIAQRAAALDGAASVAVLDRHTGASLTTSGAEIDTAVAWSQLAALAALGPGAEDIVGIVDSTCYVTRALALAPGLALFVALRRADTTVGLARALIGQIASDAIA